MTISSANNWILFLPFRFLYFFILASRHWLEPPKQGQIKAVIGSTLVLNAQGNTFKALAQSTRVCFQISVGVKYQVKDTRLPGVCLFLLQINIKFNNLFVVMIMYIFPSPSVSVIIYISRFSNVQQTRISGINTTRSRHIFIL